MPLIFSHHSMRKRLKVKRKVNNKLITADLHLIDGVREEYRWKIFPWLVEIGKREFCDSLYILGDIGDRKDHHPGSFVNRLISNFRLLLKVFKNIVVVKGNHDYDKDELTPFFDFISAIPNIQFVGEPTVIDGSLFLPHTRARVRKWNSFNLDKYSYVYLHTTVLGAKIHDSGYTIKEGFSIGDFKSFKNTMFISGDIHIPQNMSSNFMYVGSPYPIRFGDEYQGRVLLIKDEKATSINYNSLRKHIWKIKVKADSDIRQQLDKYKWNVGDYVKVEISLHPSEFYEYQGFRKYVSEFCKKNKLVLCSTEMKPIKSTRGTMRKTTTMRGVRADSILKEFCKQQKLSGEQLEIGKELL